ncbi:hypothetical protein V22_29810 [Calycomorphotria hydatis]|uniref:Uncharacterized protein n=1 Tax=Calycomorphotria hydatis TaxID=2528027 RepID=A0A517TBH3_9PLAN|nr:hypothetical protein V22_29810 [Calycomorphotria hydatis]
MRGQFIKSLRPGIMPATPYGVGAGYALPFLNRRNFALATVQVVSQRHMLPTSISPETSHLLRRPS